MQDVHVLGTDPGFANFGYCVADIRARPAERVLTYGNFETEKSAKKQNVFAADDNVRRTQEISKFLLHLVHRYNIRAFVCEAMSFPRNASVAGKMCMGWGAMCMLSEVLEIPIVSVTPKALKIAVAGRGGASKEEVEQGVIDKLGSSWLRNMKQSDREHAFDAVAAVVATWDTPVMRALR